MPFHARRNGRPTLHMCMSATRKDLCHWKAAKIILRGPTVQIFVKFSLNFRLVLRVYFSKVFYLLTKMLRTEMVQDRSNTCCVGIRSRYLGHFCIGCCCIHINDSSTKLIVVPTLDISWCDEYNGNCRQCQFGGGRTAGQARSETVAV